jgi:hypothetical protein
MSEDIFITEEHSAPNRLNIKVPLTVEEESSQEEGSPLVDAE